MKKGESGIGTLIIFIAMLLVAAIAAGVLIQTTTSLHNKALITGQASKAQISTHMDVISIAGINGSDADIENITIIAKLSAGSEPIDLTKLVLVVDSPSASQTLQYGDNTSDTALFIVTYLQNATDHQNGSLKFGDIIQVNVALTTDLTENQQARFDFIPKVGLATSVEVLTPDIMSQYRIHLYP